MLGAKSDRDPLAHAESMMSDSLITYFAEGADSFHDTENVPHEAQARDNEGWRGKRERLFRGRGVLVRGGKEAGCQFAAGVCWWVSHSAAVSPSARCRLPALAGAVGGAGKVGWAAAMG